MTNKQLRQNFEKSLIDAGKSAHTIRAYMTDLCAFIHWFEVMAGEEFDARAVGPRDIVAYRQYMIASGKKPATTNRRLVTLQRFFRWAHRQQIVTESPFEALESVRVRRQANIAPKWLTHRDQLALLRAVRRHGSRRDLAMLQLMMSAGLRVSEVVNLKLADVQIGERSGAVTIRSGKGNKYRQVPLARDARHALARYLAQRAEHETGFIFLGQRGPLSIPGVQYVVAKHAYRARLSHVTPHTLRHTFGKNLVDEGVSLDQVAALLGHETLDTVMIYTRPSQDDLEKAVRKAAGEVV